MLRIRRACVPRASSPHMCAESEGAATSPLEQPVPTSGGRNSLQDSALEGAHISVEQLGISVPKLPGDISLCGYLPPEMVEELAPRYKAWIFLNRPTDPKFYPEELALASVKLAVTPIAGPPDTPTDAQVEAALDTMDRFPRPLMIQCSSGSRAGVLLLLWLVRRHNLDAESAQELASDLDLKFWTRCTSCGPMREWVLERLERMPAEAALQDAGPAANAGALVFMQLLDPETCTFTYILGCHETKEAILIDPVREQKDRDLTTFGELGLELRYVVNTHLHADHITSGGRIRAERPEVRTAISKASGAKADILLEPGDRITFGKLEIEAISTPGHTRGCMSFLLITDSDTMVFTGDSLLIGGCGRTDFQQGDAGLLYDSVHSKLFTLPGETLVYPGHDVRGRAASTIAEEKSSNPRLTKTRVEFVKLMSELKLPRPETMDLALPANMFCGV